MSSPLICRVFPHEVADGPTNMARDEALLDLVAEDPTAAAFRTYGWSEPTLSLGYFQSVAAVAADPRWRGVSLVRRPTGGGAILHHHEMTYALVVPRDHPLAHHGVALYRAVHAAIANVLNTKGVGAHRRGPIETSAGSPTIPRPFLCFADRDSEDLVIGACKVVGSAQRRRSGAVLQHGSVLLAVAPLTPELPGLTDLTPVPADVADWAERLGRHVPESLGLRPEPAPWTDALRDRARAIAARVYRTPRWTNRR